MKMKYLFTVLLSVLFISNTVIAQEEKKDEDSYKFKIEKQLKTTSVKNQYRSGTCWAFSGLSFIETELIREGKEEMDLSEMFVVRYSYIDKAEKYVRFHGHLNFGGGGAFHDVTDVINKYGIVPEDVYSGLEYGTDGHV
ncbi:MAG: C1 family peptidase, partial [Bacteroidota bacterium]|nr:C1 family peptidase [Bacteroidota bacterium]